MNAAEQVESITHAHALASAVTLVRQYFPAASANLTPWRDDPETRLWHESGTIDLAFHFPGWTPRLECRSLLLQLIMSKEKLGAAPYLIGVLMRGITFEGERWRLATIEDWSPIGSHLPKSNELKHLHAICRELFSLFPETTS